MREQTLLLATASAAVALIVGAIQTSAQVASIELDAPPTNGTYTWKDVEGEAAYHVFGHVSYLPPPTCVGVNIRGEGIEFSEELPADSTSFTLPLPENPDLTWRKDIQLTVEALDKSGERIALNGHALTADQFCTDEQIAAELAAAGTGFEPERPPLAQLVALLAAAGAVLTAGGWLLRRRAG